MRTEDSLCTVKSTTVQLDMVTQTHNPTLGTQKVEAGKSGVQGHFQTSIQPRVLEAWPKTNKNKSKNLTAVIQNIQQSWTRAETFQVAFAGGVWHEAHEAQSAHTVCVLRTKAAMKSGAHSAWKTSTSLIFYFKSLMALHSEYFFLTVAIFFSGGDSRFLYETPPEVAGD